MKQDRGSGLRVTRGKQRKKQKEIAYDLKVHPTKASLIDSGRVHPRPDEPARTCAVLGIGVQEVSHPRFGKSRPLAERLFKWRRAWTRIAARVLDNNQRRAQDAANEQKEKK